MSLDQNKAMFKDLLLTHEYYCSDNFYTTYLSECAIRQIQYDAVVKEVGEIFMASGTGCPSIAIDTLSNSIILDDELKSLVLIFLVKSKTFPNMLSPSVEIDDVFDSYYNTISGNSISDLVFNAFANVLTEYKSTPDKQSADIVVSLFKKWLDNPKSMTIGDLLKAYDAKFIGNTVLFNLVQDMADNNKDLSCTLGEREKLDNRDFTLRFPSGSISEILSVYLLLKAREAGDTEFHEIKIDKILKASLNKSLDTMTISFINESTNDKIYDIAEVKITPFETYQATTIISKIGMTKRDILLDGNILYTRSPVTVSNQEVERENIRNIILESLCPL